MSMQDPYATLPPPPKGEGEYPDRFVFANPGQSVEGTLVDVRMTQGGDYDPCPVMDVQTNQPGPDGQPARRSVFCNPISLWRQLDSQRPAIGSYVRVTFMGLQGRAKVFQLDVAPAGAGVQAPPANGQAPAPPLPVAQPAPQAPAPAFGQAPAGPAPWEQQAPVQQQPQPPAPAPPWGQ